MVGGSDGEDDGGGSTFLSFFEIPPLLITRTFTYQEGLFLGRKEETVWMAVYNWVLMAIPT